jgi:endonuclease/exonuclease/phosphatase family metal-dependent hydrolase
MLKLISWNIQCARTPSGAADLNRVAARLAACFADGADIVLLQEIGCRVPARDGSMLGDQFAGLAARLPGYRGVRALAQEQPDGDGPARGIGCMTFSRHPILQVRRHALPRPLDADTEADRRSMPRIVLETTVATPAGSLRVLNAHLEYFSLRQRLAQVEYLRGLGIEGAERSAEHSVGDGLDGFDGRAVNDRHRHDAPGRDAVDRATDPALRTDASAAAATADTADATDAADAAAMHRNAAAMAATRNGADALLAGDLNLLPGSECHRRLLAPGGSGTAPWQDAWTLVHPHASRTPHAPTVGLHDPSPGAQPSTFDYFCVSPALAGRVRAVRVDPGVGGSDHQPLLIELD